MVSDNLLPNGRPRRGRPKTDAERRATHKSLYGNKKLPPRGTGLARMEVLKKMRKK